MKQGLLKKILSTAWCGGIGVAGHYVVSSIPYAPVRVGCQVVNAVFSAFSIYETWKSDSAKEVAEEATTVADGAKG